jgi:hypothetical protein
LACWEVEDVPWVWRVVEVVVEPPLGEGHVLDGGDGAVVVGVGLGGYVESEHARVEEGFFFVRFYQQGEGEKERNLPACPDTCGNTWRAKRARGGVMYTNWEKRLSDDFFDIV